MEHIQGLLGGDWMYNLLTFLDLSKNPFGQQNKHEKYNFKWEIGSDWDASNVKGTNN
jgi:hypothetical protein